MRAAKKLHTPSRIHLSKAIIDELVEMGRTAGIEGGWQFIDWPSANQINANRCGDAVQRIAQDSKHQLNEFGFVVLKFEGAFANTSDDNAAAAVTLFLTAIGQPIRVFKNLPGHWRQIDVDTTRPPNRSRGTGLQPLHMDFVNAEFPPDFVCLYCVRADPAGGGCSMVASFDGVETILPGAVLASLNRAIYSDGEVRDLNNVGENANPFKVYSPGASFRYRYTTNLLSTALDRPAQTALRELAALLESRVMSIPLSPGEMLVLDQRRTLHGRYELGGEQSHIPPEHRRLVLHSFLRQRPIPMAHHD